MGFADASGVIRMDLCLTLGQMLSRGNHLLQLRSLLAQEGRDKRCKTCCLGIRGHHHDPMGPEHLDLG
jgi:hypothetical protein